MVSLTEREQASIEMLGALVEQMEDGQVLRRVGFTGCSMLPMLRQRVDAVDLTKPPEQFRKYDLPMYRGANGKYVMHRIIDVREDCYICRGDNTYFPERVTRQQMVAVVCAFYRGEKRISVDNRGYRLYCRAWHWVFPVRKAVVPVYRFAHRALRWLWRHLT